VRVAQGLPPQPGPGELVDDSRRDNPNLDERNVRRRVYDALNVLIALGIIVKQKKVRGLGGVATHGARERVGAEGAARWRARAAPCRHSCDRTRTPPKILTRLLSPLSAPRRKSSGRACRRAAPRS